MIIVVNLLGLASQTAITAVFNICAVASNSRAWSRSSARWCTRRFERGPFHFGRWSVVVNAVAVAWNILMAVVFMLPTELPVTPTNVKCPLPVPVSLATPMEPNTFPRAYR